MSVKKSSGTKPTPPPVETPKSAKPRGMSLADLAEQFDFPTKVAVGIRKALKKLPVGRVYSDVEMRVECGVTSGRLRHQEWRELAEQEEFLRFQFQIENRGVFWAQPATVNAACQTVGKAQSLRELYEEKR